MSEQITNQQSLLPGLPPAETFSHPLYAAIAKKYWEDESLIEFEEALRAVAKEMTPAELLGATKLLDDLSQEEDSNDCGHSLLHAWTHYDPASVEVDDNGMIHAVIGRVSDVRDHLARDYFSDHGITENLLDNELDEAYFRNGYDPVIGVSSLVYDEQERRERLCEQKTADAREVAEAPKLFLA